MYRVTIRNRKTETLMTRIVSGINCLRAKDNLINARMTPTDWVLVSSERVR